MDTQLPLGATLDIKTLEQTVDLFATDGMPARNLSPLTRKHYRHDLVDLLAFLKDRGASTFSDISLRHLEAYQAEMDHRGYSASTRNRKTHTIKSLFHFLYRLGITAHNIADKLIPPSVTKNEPRFLSEAEYQRLLRACSHKPRDAAIIELFLQTGMRLSELAKLQLNPTPRRVEEPSKATGRGLSFRPADNDLR